MTKTRFKLKWAASAFLALSMGVAFALPLLSSMVDTTKGETGPKPQFSVDVLYAYISVCNTTVYDDDPPNFEKEVPFFNFAIVFNFTHLYDAETANCDARLEVYLIEIYSDKGFIGEMAESIGTNYTFYQIGSAPYPYVATPDFPSPCLLADWLGGPPPSGYYKWDWPTGESEVYSFGGGRNGWVQTFEEPETISMRMRGEGWVTFNGDSWQATPANGEEVANHKLEKFGNGFLYNKVVPEDQLSQIDPLHPSWSDTPTPTATPTVSPNASPTASPTTISTASPAASPTATPTGGIPPEYTYAAVAIVVIILIELGYALMRRRKPPFSQSPAFDENFIDLR